MTGRDPHPDVFVTGSDRRRLVVVDPLTKETPVALSLIDDIERVPTSLIPPPPRPAIAKYHRGDVVPVFLDGTIGHEIQTHGDRGRPCLVVQADLRAGLTEYPTLVVVPLRNATAGFRGYDDQVLIPVEELPFPGAKECAAQCGQLRAIDLLRVSGPVLARLPAHRMDEIDRALAAILGLAR